MGIKITRIRPRIIRVPLNEPFAIATQTMAECEHILAVVDTDANITGIGSVSTIPAFMGETGDIIRSAIDYLAEPLEGLDPFDIEAITELMDAELAGIASAKAAIDFACHDIMGKSLDMPVYRLIGGCVRERIACTWVVGIKGVDETVAEAKAKVDEGFRVLKIKIGHDDADDIEKIRRIRSEVGSDVAIRIDANTAYTADHGIRLLTRLEEFDLEMIEQPCREKDLRAMARLRAALRTPILADESAMSLEQVFQVIEAGAADIINIKLGKIGGIHKARKVAAIAKAANLPVLVGSNMELGPGIAAGAHLAASTAHVSYASDLFAGVFLHRRDLVDDIWDQQGMTIGVPHGPGLGVTLTDDVLAATAE
jgi:o-succinylbenzoate synthase